MAYRSTGRSLLLCVAATLLAAAALADEPVPAANPPVATTAAGTTTTPSADETATVPTGDAAQPVPDASPTPSGGPPRVLLLPLTFTVYQSGVGSGPEAVPDWTEAARRNLGDAARETLLATRGLELNQLPDLEPKDAAVLRDHVAVARLITMSGNQYRHGEWHKHRAEFDRAFGTGLGFLRERTGADYALLIDGTQVKQTGGSIFLQLALAATTGMVMMGGGGTVVNVCLLDLVNGTVAWFNSSQAIDVFGATGTDLRNAAAARAALAKLFAAYPTIPALAD